MRFYRGRGMKFDYYRHKHKKSKEINNQKPETSNQNGRGGIVFVLIVIVLLAVVIGIGSCVNRKEKEEFQQHIRHTQQKYRDNVANNLWRLKITGWKPEEFSDHIRFSAYVRNESEVGVGNVYFTLTLLDENKKIVYTKWTSYLVGKDGGFFIKIDIPKTEIPIYSSYKWDMSSEKPII